MEGFMTILKNLFIMSSVALVAWFSICVTIFLSDFTLMPDQMCVQPSVNYRENHPDQPLYVKILSEYNFIEPEF